jgi:hypothetical protein
MAKRSLDSVPLEELEKGLRIDPDALDEALQDQPQSFYAVSKELVLLLSRRDAAKQALQIVEAEVDAEIRRSLSKEEKRVTEKEIETRRVVHKDVQQASDELLELNKQAAQYQALKEAFQQRSYVLKDLVGLALSNYYGEVAVSSYDRRYGQATRDATAEKARTDMREMRKKAQL